MEALLNGKPEELIKYSKGDYDKEKFIAKASPLWDWTDIQIRMIYLTADLAINAHGVFSVTNEHFREMFEKRFKMTISRQTVIRNFQRFEELGLLTINDGKRRNGSQSANIFIIEPIEKEENKAPIEIEPEQEENDETPVDTPAETPDETHNIAINNAFNITSNKPLNNNLVNNTLLTNNQDTINKLIKEYMLKGLSKKLCFRVLDEVKLVKNIKNFGAYLRKCLENTLFKSNVKRDLMNLTEQEFTNTYVNNNFAQFNWIERNY